MTSDVETLPSTKGGRVPIEKFQLEIFEFIKIALEHQGLVLFGHACVYVATFILILRFKKESSCRTHWSVAFNQ